MILKKSKTNWIEVNDSGLRLLIENASIKQGLEIKRKIYEGAAILGENKTAKDLSEKERSNLLILWEEIKLLRIKYQVKDWESITDTEGNPIKLNLVFNQKLESYEIENEQFEMLIKSLSDEDKNKISDRIKEETEFTDADKKK